MYFSCVYFLIQNKIMNIFSPHNNSGSPLFFQMATERADLELLWGTKIFKGRSRKGLRAISSSQLVVNPWNKFSKNEAQAKKISGFKAQSDKKWVKKKEVWGVRGLIGTIGSYTIWSRGFFPFIHKNGQAWRWASMSHWC